VLRNWVENFVFHYEFARHLQRKIEGMTWRKAWGHPYRGPTRDHDELIEAAQAELSKMRRRVSY
jgi:hypothetical protein